MQSGVSRKRAAGWRRRSRSMRSIVSGNFFTTFGIGPFAAGADRPDDTRVRLRRCDDYQAWQSTYGGDPSVVDRLFYLQGRDDDFGIATGILWDRIRNAPPALWIPLSGKLR